MLWVADFETVTPNTQYFKKHQDTKVLVAGLMNENNTQYQIFSNLPDFIYYVLNTLKSHDILYFHNLKFDGNFIYKWCFKNGWRPVNSIYEVGHRDIYIFRDKDKIFEIVLGWKNKRINIKCSYLILCSGVDTLAKDLGMDSKEKFKENNPNFYDVEPQDSWAKYPKQYIEYLKNDINVVRVALLNYFNALKDKSEEFKLLKDLNKFLTTGSLSFELQKSYTAKYNLDPNKIMYCSIEEYDLYKKWFFGGLTQFNPMIQGKLITPESGKVIDINSAYPYAMTKPLPVDKLWNLKDAVPSPKQNVYHYFHMKIKKAKAKYMETPFLRNWKSQGGDDNRYCLYLQDFECYYLEDEFKTLCKYYEFEGVEIIDVYWCEVLDYLAEYINTIYDLKSYYKKLNNKSGQFLYKILLNAGYGKYAQRYNMRTEYWINTKDKEAMLQKGEARLKTTIMNFYGKKIVENDYYVFPLTKLTAVDNVCGRSNIAILKKEITRAHNILVASTITALNRVFLMETILKLGPENFYYCDTDAIFFNDKNVDISCIEIDGYKLGAWDYELNLKKLVVLGAKAYWAEEKTENKKVKFSGINKKFLEDYGRMDWFMSSEDSTVLKGATLKKKETPSGIVLVTDDYEIKERKY